MKNDAFACISSDRIVQKNGKNEKGDEIVLKREKKIKKKPKKMRKQKKKK